MIVGVPREVLPGEHRVALIPAAIPALTKAGLDVLVETGAGAAAGFPDDTFVQAGASIAASRADVFARAGILTGVRTAGAAPGAWARDLELVRPGQAIVGFADPLSEPQAALDTARRGASLFAMELMPRITRAQGMDALSAMATVAGYKAVLVAASALPRMFPMLMTAAGTLLPARVFIVGAGVAGLQAIATARRLGARVEAYDVRPAVKEQVESLGAKFVELPLEVDDAEDRGGYARAQDESFYRRQRETMARVVAASDVVVTTAAIPGRKAPVLITGAMVEAMAPGSVVVDLAAERGGNCELTRPDETVVVNGVKIIGPTNLAATVPYHASQLYARTVATFLLHLLRDKRLHVDFTDEITRETIVAHGGDVVHARVREALGLAPAEAGDTA